MTLNTNNADVSDLLELIETKLEDISSFVKTTKDKCEISDAELTIVSERVLSLTFACKALGALLVLEEANND